MKLSSNSLRDGAPIDREFAAGDAQGFAPDRNPHLAWSEVPDGVRSFALVCVDPDVPTVPETVGRTDMTIPRDQPRCDFVHWVMADIAPGVRELAAGSCSDGFVVKGKADPAGPAGSRQGLNDFTGWFAGDKDMSGIYYGYDGPCPPWNDDLIHHYHFHVYAIDVATLGVSGEFAIADVRAAMAGHVLAEAAITGTYALNPAVR